MISGSIVAVVTPMHHDGSVDYKSLENLLHWQVEQGSDAILVLGTTGETPTLTTDEKKRITQLTVKTVNGRIPVIVGTGTNCTATSIENTKLAKKLGADACLTIAPYYNKPTQAGIIAHFTAIADAVDLPQILYNHPGRCVIDMFPETVELLSRHKNIVGIKEGPADSQRCRNLRAMCGNDFAVYSGDDIECANFMLAGGHGHISVAANAIPAIMHALCKAATYEETEKTLELNEALKPFFTALGLESNPIPIKWALHAMGLMDDGIRLPLQPLAVQYRDQVMDCLNLIPSVVDG